ncbi:CpaD family pilus assembly protein [Novosphingobium sp.]|uniref:CpaD family pilus assembly protein n=1 Tax=Novosphingobium sp. TaxID=1874826 RepID=UPI003B52AFC3
MTLTLHSARAHLRSGLGMAALGLGLMLSACGGMPTNASLESVHQPIVQHTNYTLDVAPLPQGGLDPAQQHRLNDWFAGLGLKFGDHIGLDDPVDSDLTHVAVEAVAGRYGLILDRTAPVTEGVIAPGYARVVVSRAFASVPGCPDWSAKSDANYNNATSKNYGCAVNTNLAAMVANKEDLIHGQGGNGDTVVLTNTKAIDAYRLKAPTGGTALKQISSQNTQ